MPSSQYTRPWRFEFEKSTVRVHRASNQAFHFDHQPVSTIVREQLVISRYYSLIWQSEVVEVNRIDKDQVEDCDVQLQ